MRSVSAGSAARGRILLPGWVFLSIIVLVASAAVNTGNNLLYLVVASLASFILLSFVLAAWTLRRLHVERQCPRAVYRTQPFHVFLRVENRKRLVPAIALRIEREPKRDLAGFIIQVPGNRAALVSVPEAFMERGVHTLPAYRLGSSFPFGLYKRQRRYPDRIQVTVYPRVHQTRTSGLSRLQSGRSTAQHATRDGDEYFGLREYVRGDDVRMIAWRASARMGTWMIREMARYNSRTVIFALDTRVPDPAKYDRDGFEEAVELVASLAVMLARRQFNVSIFTPEQQLSDPDLGVTEHQILEMLARAVPMRGDTVSDFDARVQTLDRHDAAVLLVAPDPERWGSRCQTTQLRILDPRELIHA
ncbi:MAG: DUF58 domain-containing protein [Candidatus Hydrogenedentes bacterium]|nr:DUF58 domain-containing protein [Candidatus Hydrogenedentota bacterium]